MAFIAHGEKMSILEMIAMFLSFGGVILVAMAQGQIEEQKTTMTDTSDDKDKFLSANA